MNARTNKTEPYLRLRVFLDGMRYARISIALVLAACGTDPDPGAEGSETDDTGQADDDDDDDDGPGDDDDDGPGDDDDDDDGPDDDDDDDAPPPSEMPAGIPMPTFGWDLDTAPLTPTIYVDNTDPGCDNQGGTADAPLCDLFAGGNSATYGAGDVVTILGGPYIIDGDKSLTFDGTEDAPVVIRTESGVPVRFDAEGNRADFTFLGQYGVLESVDFFHRTRHRVESGAHHLVFRGIQVHNPEGVFIDFNPVVQLAGHDILVVDSMIYDNRRDNDNDTHGINAGSGSYNLWILDNEIYNNNGDAFQGCHNCFDNPPHHVYIGRNVMHEDRENAVDLKTIHDVVVSENVMYGYGSSGTSSGDAMVIGSNGYDEGIGQGPRRVWVLGNELRDSQTGIRIEGVEDVWIIGNVFRTLNTGIQVDDKQYRDITIAANTIDDVDAGIYSWNSSCSADSVTLENNLIGNVMGHHIELPNCDNATLSNNLVWGSTSVRVGGSTYASAAELDGEGFASGNLDDAPQFEDGSLAPAAGSPAIDAGVSLDAYIETVEQEYGGAAGWDIDHNPRPVGSYDIGAWEQ